MIAGCGPVRRFFVGIALLLFTVSPGFAQTSEADLYTMRGVEADESADSEVAAKAAAIAAGQRLALTRVLQRLTQPADHARLPRADSAVLERVVRDFSVEEEQLGGGRYIATITVRFDPDGVPAGLSMPFHGLAEVNQEDDGLFSRSYIIKKESSK